MIIDIHGHVSAPPELYAYRSVTLASRGAHGRGDPGVSDEKLEESAQEHIALLKKVGTDIQFISPRPFQQMHSEKPERIVHWWIAAVNDIIARHCKAHPEAFRGVAGLPLCAGASVKNALPELERCVKELGFIGCLLNPDPYEHDGDSPPLADEYWYPLYEKLVELDVPAMIHSAGCKSPRETYSNHFITEETLAILSLTNSTVFKDFPTLKIIVPHGGGSVPYQIGRWRSGRFRRGGESFDDSLRRLYFDTVLYNPESVEFLLRIVGTDRVMFGTELPGVGSSVDPKTGRALDDIKPVIDEIEWLTDQDRKLIFEDTARKVFKLNA